MTKISFVFFASILFFTSCENDGSSTVGTYEKEETSASPERKETEAKEEPAKNANIENVSIDTSKNNQDSININDTMKKSTKVQTKTTKTAVKS
jgi:hypothetical protein